MTDNQTAARERHEHAVRMALEAWDATSGPTVKFHADRDVWFMARWLFERAVRERLAQTAQVYEAAIDEARHD